MLACIMLHNMIIEDERDIEQVPLDLNEEASTYTVKKLQSLMERIQRWKTCLTEISSYMIAKHTNNFNLI